ncbi:hypothetical protein E2562_036639 [Oryza meyeriana var. granulata]|uniref:Uncharacterized protein n=1 Tax=Oryza meyeriana var. granulata TaxID=110450 RepID=A0A6G1DB40_9ORYZ|nr:hypothetical protein E2562_036639 [Oryza meyeriana var. granulata]
MQDDEAGGGGGGESSLAPNHRLPMSCRVIGDPRLHWKVFIGMPQLHQDLRHCRLARASSPPLACTPSVGLAELPPPASSPGTSHRCQLARPLYS